MIGRSGKIVFELYGGDALVLRKERIYTKVNRKLITGQQFTRVISNTRVFCGKRDRLRKWVAENE